LLREKEAKIMSKCRIRTMKKFAESQTQIKRSFGKSKLSKTHTLKNFRKKSSNLTQREKRELDVFGTHLFTFDIVPKSCDSR